MREKELLELAANAAGIQEGSIQRALWNPLNSSGQAFELAIKLQLHVKPSVNTVTGQTYYSAGYASSEIAMTYVHEEISNIDTPSESARRAIVRAAAEIAAQGRTWLI